MPVTAFLVTALVLIGSLCGCKKQVIPIATENPHPNTTSTPGAESGASGTSSSGSEDSTINEPVMVGGSFLTCQYDDSMSTVVTEVGAGCGIGVASQRLSPQDFDITWKVRDVFNASTPISNDKIKEVGQWYWQIAFPSEKYRQAKIEVLLTRKKNQQKASSYAFVGGKAVHGESPSGGSAINEFYIKDLSSFELSSFQNANSPTPANGKNRVNGARIAIPFRVANAGTLFSFLFGDVKGVSTSSNRLMVVRQGKILRSVNLTPGSPYVFFEGIPLPDEGTYAIVFEDAEVNGGGTRDEVILSNGQITAQNDVDVGSPYVMGALTDVVSENFPISSQIKTEHVGK